MADTVDIDSAGNSIVDVVGSIVVDTAAAAAAGRKSGMLDSTSSKSLNSKRPLKPVVVVSFLECPMQRPLLHNHHRRTMVDGRRASS